MSQWAKNWINGSSKVIYNFVIEIDTWKNMTPYRPRLGSKTFPGIPLFYHN